MKNNNRFRLFALLSILVLLFSSAPLQHAVQAQGAAIVIDGIHEPGWGDPLASDPLGDINEPNLDLQNLYVVEDTDNFYIGFNALATSWGMTYGVYIDTDQKSGSGASSDPWGRNINAVSAHLPEYTLYVYRQGSGSLENAQLNKWGGSNWSYDSLISQGGAQGYSSTNQWLEYSIPKADLGSPKAISLEVFTTGDDGHAQDSVPSDANVAFSAPDWNTGLQTTLSAFVTFPKPQWFALGSFNNWGTDNPLNDNGTNGDVTAGDGIYTVQLAIATAGRYEFKVGTSDWSTAYPASNGWFDTTSNGETVTFTLDTNTYSDGWQPEANSVGVSTEPGQWTAVGDWQGWNNSNPATAMQSQGSGIYTYSATIANPGSYQYKAVKTATWDAIGADGRGINAETVKFTTAYANQKVNFSVNAFSGRVKAEVVPPTTPQHDNNVWWDGLGHDSRSDLYRVPFGAVTTSTPVTLRFRTFHNDVTEVTLRVWNTTAGAQTLIPMQIAASTNELPYGYDYWQATIPAQSQTTILYYRFIVRDGSKEVYYEDDDLLDGSWGKPYDTTPDYSWQIDVYQPDYKTPDWMKNAVIYQIFPDRFFNGKITNDPKASDPSVYGSPVLKQNWGALPEGYCRAYQNNTDACTQQALGRDFFGGDLKGIREKLTYLKSLGVTAIYLNPIFKAPSNHLYDTTDYYTIDPYFGTNGDFAALADNAHQLGINLILDGVFNHTSSDSLYFDRYHRYKTDGGCESLTSSYRSWYTFSPASTTGSGPCAGDTTYNSWWGFDSLPVLTEVQPVRSFIYGSGSSSVAQRWILAGSSGWRLDVAPDKSHNWWQEFRPSVKSANSDAVIIGEIWDDASPWLLGNEFDSTMNYRFRRAILGFLNGASSDPNQGTIQGLNPEQFNSVLQSIKEDYPPQAYAALMNLVGSHDTQRILWALTPGERNREDKEFNAANVAEGKTRLKLLSLLQMTMPGAPTIYYGDEAGMTGDTDPDDRRAFQWDKIDTDLLDHYKALTAMRGKYSFLRTGSFDTLYTQNDAGVYVYGRKDLNGAAVIAVNNSTTAQTLTVDVSGYIPEGTLLTDALNGGSVTVAGGKVAVTVNAIWGTVLVTPAGSDLTPPSAPTGLTAEAKNGEVDLAWQPVTDSSGYFVYRSPVTGGGYTRLNSEPITETTYVDTSVTNGSMYYYVVTAVDAAGNESARSSEVSALPHLVIRYANLQWPFSITQVISAVTPTPDIYGQVYIENVTPLPGAAQGVTAQVGYGPLNSNPAGNAYWTWVDAVFNVDAGNNDEYKARLLPDTLGTFSYTYRYSTTGGREWVYATEFGPANLGTLEVVASGDTTPPAAPADLKVVEAASSFLHIAWSAPADADLFGYEVYRGSASGGPYTRVAKLQGTTEYTDWNVVQDTTYYYVLKAVDTAFNRSDYSAELAAKATARQVQVTFNVTVPSITPSDKTVYIAGSFQGWNPGANPLSKTSDPLVWTITISQPEGASLEYKFALGSWDYVEKDTACAEINNRVLKVSYGTDGTQVQNDTVANWRNVGTCPN